MAYFKKGYKILIIENNPGDYALIADLLLEQIEAPILSHAVNYKQAKEILNLSDNKFDVILLDITLPDKGGVPLIIDIVKLAIGVPVIVLTSYADFEYGVQSISLGVSDYIMKDELTSFSLYKTIIYSLERKSTVLSLEESERRYSELFHLNPLPIWVYDIDTLRILDVNEPAIKHFGYSRKEFLSLTIKDLRPVADVEKFEVALGYNKYHQKIYLDGVFRYKKKNNDIINVDILSSIIEYKGKKAKIILANDVTEKPNQTQVTDNKNDKLTEIAKQLSNISNGPFTNMLKLITNANQLKDSFEKEITLSSVLKIVTELDRHFKSIISDINAWS